MLFNKRVELHCITDKSSKNGKLARNGHYFPTIYRHHVQKVLTGSIKKVVTTFALCVRQFPILLPPG